MNSTPNVGLIGLGAMGAGMAQSLRRAGYAPYVFDIRAEVAQAFAAEGGTACASPAELGTACDVVVSVVVTRRQASWRPLSRPPGMTRPVETNCEIGAR